MASSLRSLAASASLAPVLHRAAVRSASTKAALQQNDWALPKIQLGHTHSNRYSQHYHNTLASDLMYMTYNHNLANRPAVPAPVEKPMTPYEANRSRPPVMRGNRAVRTKTTKITPDTVPKLESIVVHTMVKEAIGNKNALLSAIAALRAISGQTPNGGGRPGASGVQVIAAKHSAAVWKLRAGMPIAVKVELKGEAMYDFIQCLVDFVLPRLRDFSGVPLPVASTSEVSPASLSGVVSFGFGHTAMGFFPQIEANPDSYPRMHGFHVFFKTAMRGDHAHENARALVSGFRIPFFRQ